MVSGARFFGTKISCLYPAQWQYQYSKLEYFDEFCFFAPKHTSGGVFDNFEWIPFILFLQLSFFRLPAYIYDSVLPTPKVSHVQGARQANKCYLEHVKDGGVKRTLNLVKPGENDLETLVLRIYENLRHESTREMCGIEACLRGKSAAVAYIAFKVLQLVNVLAQLCLVTYFLGISDQDMAWQMVINALGRAQFDNYSGLFPLKVFCLGTEFTRGDMRQDHWMECILPYNYINEKIYLLMWIWFALLSVMSAVSLCSWLATLLCDTSSAAVVEMIKQYPATDELILYGVQTSNYTRRLPAPLLKNLLRDFDSFCSWDTRMFFRLVSDHLGPIIPSELAIILLEFYAAKREYSEMLSDELETSTGCLTDFRKGHASEMSSASAQGADEQKPITIRITSPPPAYSRTVPDPEEPSKDNLV
ncbi:unnamed protein product, partial [Mesorhabditis spiculigera]